MSNKIIIYDRHEGEATPVAVYDPAVQKCVLIFKTTTAAAVYLFGNKGKHSSVWNTCSGKRINRTNVFKTKLAMRFANPMQREQLGDNMHLVLDDRFYRCPKEMPAMASRFI